MKNNLELKNNRTILNTKNIDRYYNKQIYTVQLPNAIKVKPNPFTLGYKKIESKMVFLKRLELNPFYYNKNRRDYYKYYRFNPIKYYNNVHAMYISNYYIPKTCYIINSEKPFELIYKQNYLYNCPIKHQIRKDRYKTSRIIQTLKKIKKFDNYLLDSSFKGNYIFLSNYVCCNKYSLRYLKKYKSNSIKYLHHP